MRRSTANYVIAFIVIITLAGCVAAPPLVSSASDGGYRLSVTGERYETQADTNFKALNAANDFCGKKGQHLMFRQSTESGDHPWSPKQEDLTFVCVDANDAGPLHASNARTPVVAQQ